MDLQIRIQIEMKHIYNTMQSFNLMTLTVYNIKRGK